MALETLALMLCLVVSSPLSAQEFNSSDNESGSSPVGEVSLVIGKAFLSSENERELRLRAGDFVREGDIIRTESNGHVHIKFIDEQKNESQFNPDEYFF